MSNRIFGGGCVLIGALYIYFASQTALTLLTDPLGPRPFPMLVGACLSASGAVLLIKPGMEPNWPSLARLLELLFAVTVMLGYAIVMPEIGFVIATTIATSMLSWRMGARPLSAIGAGLTVAISIFVIFNKVLGLSLAIGPWGI